jgi:hypothetical protein
MIMVVVSQQFRATLSQTPESEALSTCGPKYSYEDFIASGATRLALDIDRLIVDKHCILTEGVMRMAYPGSTLAARGIAVDDESAYYLYEARMATLWPFNADGLITGEDTYTGGNGFEGIASRKLAPEDIVSAFRCGLVPRSSHAEVEHGVGRTAIEVEAGV